MGTVKRHLIKALAIIVMAMAYHIPVQKLLPDCEDYVNRIPCFTIDEGRKTVVYSYKPYRSIDLGKAY